MNYEPDDFDNGAPIMDDEDAMRADIQREEQRAAEEFYRRHATEELSFAEFKRGLYREAAMKSLDFMRRASMTIMASDKPQFMFECFLLALGWPDILGVKTAKALADKWKFHKQHVTDKVVFFQDLLDLPPAEGQREKGDREKFSQKRKTQLK